MEQVNNEQSSPDKSAGDPVTGASATDIVQDEKRVPFGEKMGSVDSAVVEQGNKKLNPNAKEWEPNANGASEDDRCLFLTFSNGYPLSKRQITNFFNREFGTCVEKVYVHRTERRKKPPVFGKVVFMWSSVPAVVMAGETQVKFVVDKKPLWCKRFHSKKNGPKESTSNN